MLQSLSITPHHWLKIKKIWNKILRNAWEWFLCSLFDCKFNCQLYKMIILIDLGLRFANCSAIFISVYAQGLNGAEALWANKKYHGHHSLPPWMVCDVKKRVSETSCQISGQPFGQFCVIIYFQISFALDLAIGIVLYKCLCKCAWFWCPLSYTQKISSTLPINSILLDLFFRYVVYNTVGTVLEKAAELESFGA